MDKELIKSIADDLLNGRISKEDFASSISDLFSDDFKFDINRKKRLGFDEFIFGASKTPLQIIEIIKTLRNNRLSFICTKLNEEKINMIKEKFPDIEVFTDAGIARYLYDKPKEKKGQVAIITAGSSDIPIAKETLITLDSCGVKAKLFSDVGVAGVHRFFKIKDDLRKYNILIVIAGMEGALPSLVAGLFPQPVIAVPTSVGYGTALVGFTPLFAMLTSCANGVTVVNIDNGFGAAMAAVRIINNNYKEDEDV